MTKPQFRIQHNFHFASGLLSFSVLQKKWWGWSTIKTFYEEPGDNMCRFYDSATDTLMYPVDHRQCSFACREAQELLETLERD